MSTGHSTNFTIGVNLPKVSLSGPQEKPKVKIEHLDLSMIEAYFDPACLPGLRTYFDLGRIICGDGSARFENGRLLVNDRYRWLIASLPMDEVARIELSRGVLPHGLWSASIADSDVLYLRPAGLNPPEHAITFLLDSDSQKALKQKSATELAELMGPAARIELLDDVGEGLFGVGWRQEFETWRTYREQFGTWSSWPGKVNEAPGFEVKVECPPEPEQPPILQPLLFACSLGLLGGVAAGLMLLVAFWCTK